jgi:hypothetical protein
MLAVAVLILLTTQPGHTLSYAGHERVVQPGLRTPPGVDLAESLYVFEQILVDRGFRVTGHRYWDLKSSEVAILMLGAEELRVQIPPGPAAWYIFEFEVMPVLEGEILLLYVGQSESIHLEAVRFEEKEYTGGDRSHFERITDKLVETLIEEIQWRLK